jgi:lipoyl(octanoyl) transferase
MQCRLIIDAPASGPWNMAVDEVLLESAGAEQTGYLRFYRWAEPTLSLGYFQSYLDRAQHSSSSGCAVVRRLTGGGAILHDQEWTYSLALPVQSPLGKDPAVLYDVVNQGTLAALRRAGLSASTFAASSTFQNEVRRQAFLCFQRRSPGDLVVGTHKIVGSAQRRRHGAVLQHGSLLVRKSSFAPNLLGANDLSPGFDDGSLISYWREELSRTVGLDMQVYRLTIAQTAAIERLAIDKFRNDAWTRRR